MPSRATDAPRPAGRRRPASATTLAATTATATTGHRRPAPTVATRAAVTAGRRLAAAVAVAAVACLGWLTLPAASAPALAVARPAARATPGTPARATRARVSRVRAAPPVPALSIASTSPVLVQTAPGTWITTILVADSGAPARAVAYKLVPITPNHRVVTGTVIACSPGTARHCPLALDQVTRVRIRFRTRFPVPLAQAALVIDGHPRSGQAATAALVPQQVQLAVQRQVGPWYDLAVPLAAAAALAALTIALILILARRISPAPDQATGAADPHPPAARPSMANGDPMTSLTAPAVAVGENVLEIYGTEATITELGADLGPGSGLYPDSSTGPGTGSGAGASPARAQPAPTRPSKPEPARQSFLRRPIYASASWSFKDSWATNITALGGAVGAIAAAAGATSTVFPGVALDRFAILLALFAAVVVMGPLVLGLCLPRSDEADRVKATGFSLLVAAFVTLIGVGGEIGTVGSLIWLSSPARDTRMALLLLPAAAFVVVTWYACRTTVELAAHSHPGGTHHHSSALTAGKDSAITL